MSSTKKWRIFFVIMAIMGSEFLGASANGHDFGIKFWSGLVTVVIGLYMVCFEKE